MALIVQKYGGSSVADASSIKRVAKRVAEAKRAGHDVVVVVSAMGDTTDELIDLAQQVTPLPPQREMDILLTAGERISMSLLAMAIHNLGVDAKSFTGQQAGVITDEAYGKARIIDVTPSRIRETVARGSVAIVAGFQGVNPSTNDVTTLGRGGSDTTAVALAASLKADVCEIYTDVDGVFTADPRIVPTARKLDRVSYDEMLELAASGAKVLVLRCVEYARRYGVPIHVRSSFSTHTGTLVTDEPAAEGEIVEQPIIAGVAHDRSEAKITVVGVPDVPGKAARIFEVVASAGVNIDMIVQNVSVAATGLTDISFTLPGHGRRGRHGGAQRAPAGHRLRVAAVRRHDRQALAHRRGHEVAPRRLGTAVRRAVGRGHQHRDDLDVGDPDLRGHPRGLARRGGPRGAHGVRPGLHGRRGRRVRRDGTVGTWD